MLILKNKSRTARTYNLPHKHLCVENKCYCARVAHPRVVTGDAGQSGVQLVERLVCTSITVLAGAESDPVVDSVVNCPEVRQDLDRGVLTVIQQKPMESERSEPASPKRNRPHKEQDK